MSATLILGDCLEKMKSLPDKSVDCFICDLPYGQLATPKIGGGQNIRLPKEHCSWDVKLNLKDFWTEVKRLCKSKDTPVLMFCNTRFGVELINSNPEWFRYDLVWNKERGVSFLLANKMPMKSHEMIYVFSKTGSYYKRVDEKATKGEDGTRCSLSVLNINNKMCKGQHPTEKPKELYEWLLKRYCPADGTVLDPTAGSFNSVMVAKTLGLKGIGIEKDRAFFYKAVSKV